MAEQEKRSLWDLDKPAPPPPEPYKRLLHTEEELKTLAKDIAAGQVFTDRHLRDENMITSVFMVLAFIDQKEDWAKDLTANCGMIYEYLSKAGPRSVNGYPCFFSLQWLDKLETEKVWEYVKKVQAVLEQI